MPLGVRRRPPSIFEPRSPTSAPNSFLVLVPESGKLPCTHQVALSPRVFKTASPLPALRFSKKPRTTRLLSSVLIVILHQAAETVSRLELLRGYCGRAVQRKSVPASIEQSRQFAGRAG